MHLQQTKRASATSGGPQSYFHDLSTVVKNYLRSQGAVPVALVTPYGATKSTFKAVSKDHKLASDGAVVPGSVGHDRIQQAESATSIGEAIRYWYGLPAGQFERVDIEIDIWDEAFYLRPLNCKYARSSKSRQIQKVERPLTFTRDYASPFWMQQIQTIRKQKPELLAWSVTEISRVAAVHRPDSRIPHIQEVDLLRSSGPLHHLGVILGGYVGKGYDCCRSKFEFLSFPPYGAPIEIKRNSHGFKYQQKKYGKDELSRAVILCANHDHPGIPQNIDVIELEAFYKFGRESLALEL